MEPGLFMMPLQFIAARTHATKNIRFASGVLNLPQQHPAQVAGRVAQFDHLCEGGYIMGVGPGGQVTDMELYGTMGKNTPEMTTDSIKILHKIWAPGRKPPGRPGCAAGAWFRRMSRRRSTSRATGSNSPRVAKRPAARRIAASGGWPGRFW